MGKVAALDDIYASMQVAHLGLVDTVEHPALGPHRRPGASVTYGRTPREAPSPPLPLAEHDDGVP
jgi:crotonobetainyl-CoA:carnitine CoA-transferase CaiB-like acyl-CoA transferase